MPLTKIHIMYSGIAYNIVSFVAY